MIRIRQAGTILFGLNFCFTPVSGSTAETEPMAHKDNQFTEFFRRSSGWTAGDGAISIPLSDGRVLWLFGDSHLDDIDPISRTMPCLFQARNAGLVISTNGPANGKTLAGKGPGFRSWLKNSRSDSQWFWPLGGF